MMVSCTETHFSVISLGLLPGTQSIRCVLSEGMVSLALALTSTLSLTPKDYLILNLIQNSGSALHPLSVLAVVSERQGWYHFGLN